MLRTMGHDAVEGQGDDGGPVADPGEGDQDPQQGDGGDGVEHIAHPHHRRGEAGMLGDPDPRQQADGAGHGDGGQGQVHVGQQQLSKPVRPLPVQGENFPQKFHYGLRMQTADGVRRAVLHAPAALEAVLPVDLVGRARNDALLGAGLGAGAAADAAVRDLEAVVLLLVSAVGEGLPGDG